MERVQYQQEQMLPELKDLVEKNLFTETEIRQIVKQRTAFETALVRRVAKKADFIRYISYEMDLETLRRKRVKRMDLPKSPASVSDYAFVRRQFHIFERALKRFKADVGMWIQYIQVAKREGARALVGRVTARALQLHPNNPTFYILAASHELDNLSPSAARAMLQRGIRANPDSVDMWKEYVKMELGFIESIRRRWDVLGIKVDAEKSKKGKEKEQTDPSPDPMEETLEGNGTDDKPDMAMDVDEDGVEGAEARQQIMEGAIVKSVILNAAQALPKIELFVAIEATVAEFPSAVPLKEALLDTLFDALANALPRDPKAMEMRARRHLKGHPSAPGFVDGLRAANEEMLAILGESAEEPLLEAYASFVETWWGKVEDEHLKMYLISSLRGLIQKDTTSGPLLAVHIKLLMKAGSTAPAKLRKTAMKYTNKAPASAQVWISRLEVEKMHSPETVREVWAEARKKVRGSEEDVGRVWTWGLGSGGDREAQKEMHEELLRESMQELSLHRVHEDLLVNYVENVAPDTPGTGTSSDQLHFVHHMARRYLTTARVWETVFNSVDHGSTDSDGKATVLCAVHGFWRERDEVSATLRWAQWLVSHGRGEAATAVIVEGQGRLGKSESAELLRSRWVSVLGVE